MCQQQRLPVIKERILRVAARVQRCAQGRVDPGRIGRQSLGLLCFRQGLRNLILRQQHTRFLHVAQCGGEWNVEMAIVDEDA